VNALLAVFRYELRKSVTAGRVAWWFVLAVFPVTITLLSRWVQSNEGEIPPPDRNSFWSILLYVAIPCVCCAMSALLTAGPAIATELEQRSWIYLATRPHGIAWLLLGKFLVATLWAFTAAAAAVSASILPPPHTPPPTCCWGPCFRDDRWSSV
jgi:ABC-type transport system involved in multi-copper enzyme maturation permease subunit